MSYDFNNRSSPTYPKYIIFENRDIRDKYIYLCIYMYICTVLQFVISQYYSITIRIGIFVFAVDPCFHILYHAVLNLMIL